MATASQGNLILDLGRLEKALAKASQITDQGMRGMQQRVEDAGRKIGEALTRSAVSALDATSSTFGDLQKVYDPAADAAQRFIGTQSSLQKALKQNKSAGTDFAQTLKDLAKSQNKYSSELEKLRNSGDFAASQVGMSGRRKGLAAQLNANDEQYALARKALDEKFPQGDVPSTYVDKMGISFPEGDAFGKGGAGGASYATQLEALKTAHSDMALQIQSNYAQMTDALGDWSNGATAALDDYMDKSGNVAEQSKTVFTNAFNKMDEAIMMFATTGKFSFSDFTQSVLKDMATLAAKTAASKALSSLFGVASSAITGWLGGAPTPTTTKVGGLSHTFNPQLDVSSQNYTPSMHFAKGGAFTNSIATGPSLAPMALFGEAGPEAIMPLSRGSDGSLGVRALGGGQSTSSNQVVIQQTINVADGQAEGTGGELSSQNIAKAYAGSARQGAAEQIARDLKPGGQIWAAINGR